MTPAELKVIEAARAYWNDADSADSHNDLMDAVEALEADRENGPEMPVTWGQVVEGDQIYSPKTLKWYSVISAAGLPNGRTRIQAKGLPKPITPESDKPVRVRRGATGQAVDVWQILWSAQNVPSAPELIESEES